MLCIDVYELGSYRNFYFKFYILSRKFERTIFIIQRIINVLPLMILILE